MGESASKVQLDATQRNWLMANTILPTAFATPILLVMAAVLWVLHRHFHGILPVTIFLALGALLLAAVTIAVALHVVNNLRDWRSGVAEVAVVRVLAKRETGRAPNSLSVEFADVGVLITPSEVYAAVVVGSVYRITYSIHTRRCWTAT